MRIQINLPKQQVYRLSELRGRGGVYRPVNPVNRPCLIFIPSSPHTEDKPFYLNDSGEGWSINWTANFNNGGPPMETDDLVYKVEIESILGKVV